MTRFHQKPMCDFFRNTGINQTLPKITKTQDLISIPVRVNSDKAREQRNIAVSELFISAHFGACPLFVRYSYFLVYKHRFFTLSLMHNNEYYSFSFHYKNSAWHIIRRSILFGGRTETWTQTSEHSDYSQFSKLLPYQLGLCDLWWRIGGSNPLFRDWKPLVLTC